MGTALSFRYSIIQLHVVMDSSILHDIAILRFFHVPGDQIATKASGANDDVSFLIAFTVNFLYQWVDPSITSISIFGS